MGASSDEAVTQAQQVLCAWSLDAPQHVERLSGGLINDTFSVRAGANRYILQRVNPIFAPEIHRNIAAVTDRLQAVQMPTLKLCVTVAGGWFYRTNDAIWRLMTRLPGVSFHRVQTLEQARSAAALLGRFQRALDGMEYEFIGQRTGVHDTAAHLHKLAQAVGTKVDHPLRAEVALLADGIAEAAQGLPSLDGLPVRVVHGDPKFSNVLFLGPNPPQANEALAMVDLDTVGPALLAFELGDMWRSWCNASGEDDTQARFDMNIYEASLDGYRESSPALSSEERESLIYGLEWISLELSARFAADALLECYFGWDAQRFASRGQHNLVRARGQWSLHEQAVRMRGQRARLITEAW